MMRLENASPVTIAVLHVQSINKGATSRKFLPKTKLNTFPSTQYAPRTSIEIFFLKGRRNHHHFLAIFQTNKRQT